MSLLSAFGLGVLVGVAIAFGIVMWMVNTANRLLDVAAEPDHGGRGR